MLEQRHSYTVYILSGADHGPVFINVAANLSERLRQHKSGKLRHEQFRIDKLVHTEVYSCPVQAKVRARALKQASREWLDHLISSHNPSWQDLYGSEIKSAEAA